MFNAWFVIVLYPYHILRLKTLNSEIMWKVYINAENATE